MKLTHIVVGVLQHLRLHAALLKQALTLLKSALALGSEIGLFQGRLILVEKPFQLLCNVKRLNGIRHRFCTCLSKRDVPGVDVRGRTPPPGTGPLASRTVTSDNRRRRRAA